MNGKKWLAVFQPGPLCRLSYSQLLVYSYRSYQDEYDHSASIRDAMKATGLSSHTVQGADDGLRALGLLDGHKIQPPAEGWVIKAKREINSHWRQAYAYWRLLIRKPGCGLSPIQAGLYSYLLHCSGFYNRGRKWAPKKGWTYTYLAVMFRAKRQTIADALKRLEDLGFVHVEHRRKSFLPQLLGPSQAAACFEDSGDHKQREENFIPVFDLIDDDWGIEEPPAKSDEVLTAALEEAGIAEATATKIVERIDRETIERALSAAQGGYENSLDRLVRQVA